MRELLTKRFLAAIGIGLLVVGALVAGILYVKRGSHIALDGRILKVRTLAMDENSTVAALDFRFTNTSDYVFVVRTIEVSLEAANGERQEGSVVADSDIQRLLRDYPLLGPRYNETLLMRARIGPRQTLDRMIVARFEMPEKQVADRRDITIRIEHINGLISEIKER